MTLATTLFGTETRLRPLVKAVLVVTALRAAWIAVNVFEPHLSSLGLAVVPWPSRSYSWTSWLVELALIVYQLRASIRLARLLLLRYAPRQAAFLGFSTRPASDGEQLKPRNRSWWPTALLLCCILILTCHVVTWLTLMLWFRSWAPFDWYAGSDFARYPMYVGMGLSVLGLMFGGSYIARASGDVSTSFGVVPLADDHWLAARVHGFADQLGLPRPAVGVTNVMNAFAMGANRKSSMVVIGKPLFDFEKAELDAIIGHELGHILHNDVARMQFAEGFQRMLVKVVNTLTVFGMVMAASASKKRANARLNAHLAWGTGTFVRKTVFVASELVAKGISRHREFHADAVGAHVTSTEAMSGALRRIHGMAAKPTAQEHHYGYLMFRGAGFGSLFSTHPTLQARLHALDARIATPDLAHLPTTQSIATIAGHAQGLGLAGPASGRRPPSTLWRTMGSWISGLARMVRRGSISLWTRANLRRLGMAGAACVLLLLVAPAINSFYGLDRRLNDATTSTGHALSSSWAWVVATKEAWWGDTAYNARISQVEAREQALKAAEARLSEDRDALGRETARLRVAPEPAPKRPPLPDPANVKAAEDLRTQVRNLSTQVDGLVVERDALQSTVLDLRRQLAQPERPAPVESGGKGDADGLQAQVGELSGKVSGLVAQRDDLRNTILDLRRELAQVKSQAPVNTNELLLQLDAANADRTRLTARLADLQKQAVQPAQQEQIASLTDQLTRMTADRDEMIRRNDVLRGMNLELKGQIATGDIARLDIQKQLDDFKSRIDSLSAGQPSAGAGDELPVVQAAPSGPTGGYGALAVAGNGTVILTDRSFQTEQEAADAALAECGQFSGGSPCATKQTFRKTCAAVARVIPVTRRSHYMLQLESTVQDAEEMALSECYHRFGRPCEVTRQVCVN